MESSELVIDTNIFISFLRAQDKTKTELFNISGNKIIYISAVTLYELLMGATDERKKNDVHLLTKDSIILPFDEEVSVISADIYQYLRKTNKLIEFRDIFIAATCLAYKLPLLTTNKSHFERINDLFLI